MSSRLAHAATLALLLPAMMAPAGCANRDGPTAPSTAAPGTITPLDITRAWPHGNGQSFTYRYVVRTGGFVNGRLYPTRGEVPAVTLDLVAALLLSAPPFTVTDETVHTYTLAFQDSATTGSGVRGQWLVPAIGSSAGAGAAPAGIAAPPLLLPGGVWRQEADRIALYGDVSNAAAWVFLEGALADRAPWETHPLPRLAPDVVMRARAYQTVTADVMGLRLGDALDVHYLFDYGVAAETDAGGALLGYRRDFAYGRVVWGRDAGPLYLFQRTGLTAGDPPTMATQEATLLLEQTSVPALAVR